MFALSQKRSPLFSRPWFAALAMTTGASAMALGAYTAENPLAFASKTARPAPIPVEAAVVRKVELSPATELPSAPEVVLDEVSTGKLQPNLSTHPNGGAE